MDQGRGNSNLTGVILAAGKGTRAYPSTKYIPKALLEVDGKPLIEYNIQIMRDQLGIREIVVVIGHYGEKIVEYFENLPTGVKLVYAEQKTQKGIGHALLTVEKAIHSPRFVVMLADEFYPDRVHDGLLKQMVQTSPDAIVMFKTEFNRAKISCNYTAELGTDNRVKSLTEKPASPHTDLMGVGTYLLNKKIFDYIRSTPPSELRNEVEITDVLSNMAKNEKVFAHIFDGNYVNVNNTDDLNFANYLFREKHFDEHRISVVVPAFNEEETIVGVIDDFIHHPNVDEVLVIDNNSADGTNELSQKAGARVIMERNQGYGCALLRGLLEAKGDIIILTEADGTFSSKDVPKFLEYLKDSDMVIGTRTTRQMIEQGANMPPLVRWINVIFGKIVEILWWNQEPRYTDVGCTYRAIWKKSFEKIVPFLHAKGPDFSTEMMIAVMICKQRVIEIPVTYRRRFSGESKHSGSFMVRAKTALKMLKVILKYRFLTGKISNV